MSWISWLFSIRDSGSVEGIRGWDLLAWSPLALPLLLIVIAAGIALGGLNLAPHLVLRPVRRVLLLGLRLAGMGLIVVIVLQLEADLTLVRRQNPQVAVLIDTSESMALKDCPQQQSRLAAAVAVAKSKIEPSLGRHADLSWHQASWRLAPGLPEPAAEPQGPTDLGTCIRECIETAGTPRAIILLSDGKTAHQDRLAEAATLAKRTGVQVFGICPGKPGRPRAISVRVTGADAYVRLGDEVSLTANVAAQDIAGRGVTVNLFEDDNPAPCAERSVEIADKAVPVTFRHRPTTPGRHRYRIAAGSVKEAVTDLTNATTTTVEVIDEPIRVLYVEGTPRYELKFLGRWLARDPVLELTTVTRMPKGGWYVQGKVRHKKIDEGFPVTAAEMFDYDVLILGDIPRAVFREGGDLAETRLVQVVDFVVKRGGGLITLGGQSVYGAGLYQGSVVEQVLPFQIGGMKNYQLPGLYAFEPAKEMLSHPVMALSDDPRASREAWYDMPKLDGCNVVGALKPAATLLAYRFQNDKTYPLIATHDVGRGRVLSLTCDTTWRWELQRKTDVDNYRAFWGRAVRYVAADPRTRPGRPSIVAQSTRPVVGTEFPLVTTLLDPAYGPVRNADLKVDVTEPSGRTYTIYPADLDASPGLYQYGVLLRERGLYTVKSSYRGAESTREILAGDTAAEMDDPGADLASLSFIARETGGKAGSLDEADSVLAAVSVEPEHYEDKVTVALWNLPLTAGLLILVVCADCYARKRSGLV